MSHRCDLCGEFYESGRLFVSAQASACNECIGNLIDDETDRRGERRDAEALSDGWSGGDRLQHVMSEAQQIKRG
jgi:predicted  nucleic acid-binding Zn-ribbon protein